MLVEGLVLAVRDHNYHLSLFFWILDFVRGSDLFLLQLFVFRRSDQWTQTEACTEWFQHEMVLILILCLGVLSKNFLVVTRYCYSVLFKLIILPLYVCWDLVHCLVSQQYQKWQTIFVCVLHSIIFTSSIQLFDWQKVWHFWNLRRKWLSGWTFFLLEILETLCLYLSIHLTFNFVPSCFCPLKLGRWTSVWTLKNLIVF